MSLLEPTVKDLEARLTELDYALSTLAASGIEPPAPQLREYEQLKAELKRRRGSSSK